MLSSGLPGIAISGTGEPQLSWFASFPDNFCVCNSNNLGSCCPFEFTMVHHLGLSETSLQTLCRIWPLLWYLDLSRPIPPFFLHCDTSKPNPYFEFTSADLNFCRAMSCVFCIFCTRSRTYLSTSPSSLFWKDSEWGGVNIKVDGMLTSLPSISRFGV